MVFICGPWQVIGFYALDTSSEVVVPPPPSSTTSFADKKRSSLSISRTESPRAVTVVEDEARLAIPEMLRRDRSCSLLIEVRHSTLRVLSLLCQESRW